MIVHFFSSTMAVTVGTVINMESHGFLCRLGIIAFAIGKIELTFAGAIIPIAHASIPLESI